MDGLRVLVDAVVWALPAVLAVAAVGSQDLQQLVVPVFLVLVIILTVGAVIRFWPIRED